MKAYSEELVVGFKPIKFTFELETEEDLITIYSVLCETTACNLINAIEPSHRIKVTTQGVMELQDVAYESLRRYFSE